MKTRSMLPILALVGALAVVSPELTVVDQAIALDGAGPGYGNKDTATRNKQRGYATTIPDRSNLGIREVTRMPQRFTSRAEGSRMDSGCRCSGENGRPGSSKGKTGGDMGY